MQATGVSSALVRPQEGMTTAPGYRSGGEAGSAEWYDYRKAIRARSVAAVGEDGDALQEAEGESGSGQGEESRELTAWPTDRGR